MRATFVFLLVLGFARPLLAQDETEVVRIKLPSLVRLQQISDDKHGKALALVGALRFERPGAFTIQAQSLVIWFDPRADTRLLTIIDTMKKGGGALPIWAVRAIYAEGGTRAPVVFQAGGQIMRASSMYYDLQRHEGIFVDSELRVRRRASGVVLEKLPALVFRAEHFRARGPGRWSAKDVSLFTSDYLDPEVELRIRDFDLENEQARRAVGKLILLTARGESTMGGPTAEELASLDDELNDLAETQDGTEGTLTGVRATFMGLPFFGWRRLRIDGENLDNTVVRLQIGRINSMGRGAYAAFGKKSRPLGWVLGAGYVNGHGPLIDTELDLNTWKGRARGRTRASYFRDRGVDFNGFVPPSQDRYWWQNRYRLGLTDKLRFDLEFTLQSDEHYLRIYDEREFKEGKAQESLGYLRWKDSWFYGTLIYQWQSIEFLEVKEQLPAAGLVIPTVTLARLGEDGHGRPILLQLGMETQLGNFRFAQSENSIAPDFRTARYDLDPTLFVSFNVGPVRIVPFAKFRYTWYDETLDGTTGNRYAGSAGIRADMQMSRWYGDVEHIVNMVLGYEDLYTTSVDSSDIFQMDIVDRVTPWEGLIARLRNRFLKKTESGRREFLNFELVGTWFPDGKAPLGVQNDGFIELDMTWYPSPGWIVEMRGDYFSNTGKLESGSIVGRWGGNDDIGFWGSVRHLQGDSDVVTAGAEFLVEDRWRIVLFSQYDIRNDDALDQVLMIQRMGKTFLIGGRLKWDPGEDQLTLSFKFDLLERFRSDRRDRALDEMRREVKYP